MKTEKPELTTISINGKTGPWLIFSHFNRSNFIEGLYIVFNGLSTLKDKEDEDRKA